MSTLLMSRGSYLIAPHPLVLFPAMYTSVPWKPQKRQVIMTYSSSCYSSYFPSIPMLINTSGILSQNHTDNEEKMSLVRDFVNNSIHGNIIFLLAAAPMHIGISRASGQETLHLLIVFKG